MTDNTIIDLSLGDLAQRENNSHLFHRKVYKQLSQGIEIQLERSKVTRSQDNINHIRSHHAFLLNGERGTGKTSILVNLRGFIEREEDFKKIGYDILFLDPVDPTLLNDHEDFLNIVVGQINKSRYIKDGLCACKLDQKESYYRSLENFATALEGEQSTSDRFGLDRLLSYQGSLDIAQRTHDYFFEALKVTGKSLIVITIDDVDMSLHHGFKVLEVLRKYICSPCVIPIVSGDFLLYRELVGNQFCMQLVHKKRSDPDKKAQREQAQKLAVEYLRKVFPVQQRIMVPSIKHYCEKFPGQSTIIQNGNAQKLGNLYSIYQWLLVVLNGRVNGEEKSAIAYTPQTARELMQWLNALKPVLEKLPNIGFPPLQRDKGDSYNIKDAITRWWLTLPKEASTVMLDTYNILSSYFNYSQESRLHELCEALKDINDTRCNVDLNNLTYLNPMRQLEINTGGSYERPNENYKLYIELGITDFTNQSDRLPSALMKKAAQLLTALPAIEPIDNKLKFKKDYLNTCIKEKDNDRIFLLCLFSYNDYYTSYQTASLVFFGRFFELITTSLIKDIDGAWLRELLSKPPYYSIMSISTTKTFDLNEDEQDSHDDSSELDMLNFGLDDLYLNQLANDINAFRKGLMNNHDNEPFFADVSLLTALQSKYFNQLNLYKVAGYKNISKKSKRPSLTNDALLNDIALRAAYCYWGALGSFEKSTLYFDKNISNRIAHENFFAVSKEANSSVIKNSNTYRLNIEPFTTISKPLDPLSFTQLLEKHPVYKFILHLKVEIQEKQGDKVDESLNIDQQKVIINNKVIKKILRNLIDDNEASIAVNANDRNYVIVKVTEFYDDVNKYATKTQQSANELIANFKLSQFIKNDAWNRRNYGYLRLPHLIWTILLKQDTTALENEQVFVNRLIAAGVDKVLAKLLAAGIEA